MTCQPKVLLQHAVLYIELTHHRPPSMSPSKYVLGAWSRMIMALAIAIIFCTPAYAGELLGNRSFESPVVTSSGNNVMASIPYWTISNQGNSDPNPFNIILASSVPCCFNPSATPSGGGQQYLDISGTSGQINQLFTVAADGMISFSGWFSVRDSQQNLSGMVIRVRNMATNQVVGSSSVSFDANEPIGLWKQALVSYLPVSAGTYQFEAYIPNPANFDLASVQYAPPVFVSKASTAYWDPVSNQTNPKMIPGALVTYAINVKVPIDYNLTANSLVISDATPANLALIVADFQGAGSGPIAFATSGFGLSYSYAGVTSPTDNLEFSNDGGVTWTYTPIIGPDGSDPAITHFRVIPSGTLSGGSTAMLQMRYLIK